MGLLAAVHRLSRVTGECCLLFFWLCVFLAVLWFAALGVALVVSP